MLVGNNELATTTKAGLRLPCGCGGTTRAGSPNGAHPELHSKPLDAAIGRVLASHRRGGRHGRQLRSKTQNTKKTIFS